MYEEMHDWLCRNSELSIPGIGIFRLQRKAASLDFRNKQILPPQYQFDFESKDQAQTPSRGFFNSLSALLAISDREAIIKFNDFVFELKKELTDGHTIEWKGVGVLTKPGNGEVHFTPESRDNNLLQPVPAEKIIRENASHKMLVGEKEISSEEMTELLHPPKQKQSRWWAWAMAIAILAIIFIAWNFSVHGLDPSAASNTQKLNPEPTVASYRILP